MKRNLNLYLRLTRKYNEAYSHLDEWAGLTKATEKMPEAPVWDGDGESATTKLLVTLSPSQLAEAKRVYRAVRPVGTFTQALNNAIEANYVQSCSCEHDCCGHWFGYGTAVRVKPREWMVTVRRSMNV